MKHFKHMQATSADQAAKEAASGKAWVMAGGTDLLGTLKDEIFPEYPETVIDLKTIEGMDAIEEDGDALRIGALAKLSDVAENELVKTYAAALAQAAGRVASPTIRHMGTIGGNVCQMHRCWYFRVPDDRFTAGARAAPPARPASATTATTPSSATTTAAAPCPLTTRRRRSWPWAPRWSPPSARFPPRSSSAPTATAPTCWRTGKW